MVYNLKNVDKLYNSKNVVTCCKRYDSVYLLKTGIDCDCKNTSKLLGKLYNWCTILLYKENTLLYIETTLDIQRRLRDLEKIEYLKNTRVHVSVTLGENILSNLLKPEKNELLGKKIESDSRCIGKKLECIKVFDIIPKNTKNVLNIHMNNVGIIICGFKYLEDDWCLKIDSISCKCDVACRYRMMINKWKGKELWYPLNISELKMEYKKEMNKRKYERIDFPIHSKEFCNNIFEKRVCVEKKTRDGYIKVINGLHDVGVLKDASNIKNIIEYLKKRYTKSTLKQQLLVMKIYIKSLMIEEEYNRDELLDCYTEEYKRVSNDYNISLNNQEKNNREKDNWATMDDLKETYEKTVLNKDKSEREYQEYLGIKLVLYQQTIRNDYGSLKYNNINKDMDNYIDMDKMEIIWNDYKTKKKHGRIVYKLKEELKDDIKEIILKRKRENDETGYIFLTKNSKGMGNDNFGSMIRNVLKTSLNKHIGVQMIRKIKISDARKNDLTIKEEQELANDMMHTSETSRRIYRKI